MAQLLLLPVQAAGLNHTPGTLFALPLVDFPAGFIKAFIDWELPKGRHQDDHYLHPAVPLVSLTNTAKLPGSLCNCLVPAC